MTSIEALYDRFGPAYRWLAAAAVMISAVAVVLSTTIVNVAIPDVMGAFGISAVQAQWISTGFLAAMTATMLLTDWADRAFGLRTSMIVALMVFMSGSILGGIAPNQDILTLARVIQGAAAGLVRFLCPPMESLLLFCEDIGPGLIIQHGHGAVIVAERIGAYCWINQQVTLGTGPRPGSPILGDHVRIAPGAKVLGHIRIGDRSIVGANAVVTKDVPPDVTVVGVPAYIMRRDGVRVREEL